MEMLIINNRINKIYFLSYLSKGILWLVAHLRIIKIKSRKTPNSPREIFIDRIS
jgi:hypothetical protein